MKGLHWEGTLNARNHETDLDVPTGRMLAVVGPNGAGKSTLLDLLCGLLKPDRGRLDIDGQVLVDSRRFVPAHRRRIGLLGQQPLLFPHLDVLSNVAYGPAPRNSGATRPGRWRWRCWSAWMPPLWPPADPTSCQVVRRLGSRWPGRWPPGPARC